MTRIFLERTNVYATNFIILHTIQEKIVHYEKACTILCYLITVHGKTVLLTDLQVKLNNFD